MEEEYEEDDGIETYETVESFGINNWIGIGKSVGVNLNIGKTAIVGAKWNSFVDCDSEAVGLIHDYAKEIGVPVIVELPNVLIMSPLQLAPKDFAELCRRHDIKFT